MILPLNIFSFIESALSVIGVILVVIVVICVIGFIGLICHVKSCDEKAEREKNLEKEKQTAKNGMHNSDSYKKIFLYCCSMIKNIVSAVPEQCKEELPSEWLAYTQICFSFHEIEVKHINATENIKGECRKSYDDFGCKHFDVNLMIDLLCEDLNRYFPILKISRSSMGQYIYIYYANIYNKHSPYKK